MNTSPIKQAPQHVFKDVEAWIFDLDNTLYPRECDLFSQIDWKMTDYVAQLLDLPKDQARKIQKDYYQRHGTTLRGLMIENKIDPQDYLNIVHDIDYSPVNPDPSLAQALQNLPGKKYIFTNGDVPHAERTLAQLGVLNDFDDIFDIIAADLVPKPNGEVYDMFINRNNIDPNKAAMFEDLQRNLTVPFDLGMQTVLVVPENTDNLMIEEWEIQGEAEAHIHHVTSNLASFLHAVTP